jgi:hypothetical protein
MLASSDAAKRKLGVAILSQDALPVATELLRSKICDDRPLGLQILKDVDLVVSPDHIDELSRQIRENCTLMTEVQYGQSDLAIGTIIENVAVPEK